MRIGVVVHGPQIVDTGFAEKILGLLKNYGTVKARLGGTMGRTAVIDANLEGAIDINYKLLPSQSIDKISEDSDVVFLINYGKSCVTGHAFGYKVYNRCKSDPNLIQIERPGEPDGTIIPWKSNQIDLADAVAKDLKLKVMDPSLVAKAVQTNCISNPTEDESIVYRKIAGVSADENIFLNGIVIGKSTSSDVTLIAENGILTQILGGIIKEHGVEKLGKIELDVAVVKTGLLRRSKIKPRIIDRNIELFNKHNKLNISYLSHAAEDIYKLKDSDLVVTVGDDTTLVAADILYRFRVPIIGITDGDLDRVVEQGFRTVGSMIVELESGYDDIIGKKIFSELFNGKQTMEIENIENFKSKIIQIISNTTSKYNLKHN
ncbi:MAG: DUF2117 domain-containing protein [Methanobacterium sp.]|uniref:DUF2117 family protein n=1 Tax=Methanobacterium sp. TaxID=2164 RepID=UPI003C763B7E